MVRLDRSTGDFIGDVFVGEPGGLQWQDGLWVQTGAAGGRQDRPERRHRPAIARRDFLCRHAGRSGTLRRPTQAGAVERSRNRGGAPADRHSSRCRAVHHHGRHGQSMDLRSAARLAHHQGRNLRGLDASWAGPRPSGPCVWRNPSIGNSVWARMGPAKTGGSRLIELAATGPTGREEPLQDGLDPDGAVVAFGSVWIPWEAKGAMYQYPVSGLPAAAPGPAGLRNRAGRPVEIQGNRSSSPWADPLTALPHTRRAGHGSVFVDRFSGGASPAGPFPAGHCDEWSRRR